MSYPGPKSLILNSGPNSLAEKSAYSQILNVQSGGPTYWVPSDEGANLFAWFRGDSVARTGSDIQTLIDKGPNGNDCDCTTNRTSTEGGFVEAAVATYVASGLNGNPIIRLGSSGAGGGFGNNAPPSNVVGTNIVGAGKTFTCAWLLKGSRALATNEYTSLGVFAGSTLNDSVTLYFVNIAGFSTLYWQYANSTCQIIQNTTPFVFQDYNDILLSFNGGNPATPSNYTLYINGVADTVIISTAAGGNAPFNWIGNHGDVPDIAPGDMADFAFFTDIQLDPTKWAEYQAGYWNRT